MGAITVTSEHKAIERRDQPLGAELRAAPEGSGSPGTLVGYAAVFNRASEDLGDFVEVITPGAFSSVLDQDVRCLFNHDDTLVLGRTKSGTLRLAEDQIGLRVEVDLPNCDLGERVAEAVRRLDIDGMSFAFVVGKVSWDFEAKPPVRRIEAFSELIEVSPVTWPAYIDTSIALRSLGEAKQLLNGSNGVYSLTLAKARVRLAEALSWECEAC